MVQSNDNEIIVGANVYNEGTFDGATSDINGYFHFKTSKSEEVNVLASYLGYEDFYRVIDNTKDSIFLQIILEESANELNTVVITAGAFEASDEKKAVLLKPLDIVTTAGATADLAGALNTLPGTQTVGEEGRLFVRGGDAYETQTFIDGLPVLKPYNSSVPNIPARNRFSPFLFKGTVFSTGGYSAEYGQALSSALLLNTQDLAPKSETSLSLMSVGLALGKTQRWDKSSLAVQADYSNLAPYMGLIDQDLKWYKAPESFGGQFIYRKQTSSTGILKVQGNLSRNILAMDYPSAEEVTITNRLDLSNTNAYINANYKEILGDKWTLFIGAGWNNNLDEIQQGFDLEERESSLQSKWKLLYTPNEDISIKVGGEYWHSNFNQQFLDKEGELYEIGFSNNYTALFNEVNWQISRNVVARIGNRISNTGIINEWTWAPRLSFAWKTGDKSQLSFAHGQFFQAPQNDFLRFERDLQSEQATHWIINWQRVTEGRTFRVEAYEKQYHNLITINPNENLALSNQGNGYARGIDLFFRDRTTIKNGDYWLSYSYLDAKRKYRDFPVKTAPNFVSRHNVSVVYKHWVNQLNTQFGLTYSYASPRWYDDPNTPTFNDRQTRAFQDLSFNASYLTRLFDQFTIVYVSVTNIAGFANSFGQRFSTNPNEDGLYTAIPIQPTAKRFAFIGVFISFESDK